MASNENQRRKSKSGQPSADVEKSMPAHRDAGVEDDAPRGRTGGSPDEAPMVVHPEADTEHGLEASEEEGEDVERAEDDDQREGIER